MSEYSFSKKRDGTYQLDSYDGSSTVLNIPAEYDGRPVTAIADNAFSWSDRI